MPCYGTVWELILKYTWIRVNLSLIFGFLYLSLNPTQVIFSANSAKIPLLFFMALKLQACKDYNCDSGQYFYDSFWIPRTTFFIFQF
jgi:hypothetical protein